MNKNLQGKQNYHIYSSKNNKNGALMDQSQKQ